MNPIIRLRRDIHQNPELSGAEYRTADRIVAFFADLKPDAVITGLGGAGVAIVFRGEQAGPTVMLRSELDALPIQESGASPIRSQCPGIAHLCGHDGHIAILAAVGTQLSAQRPSQGRVVLLFQPAEETGQGAARVLQDPQFQSISPDLVFALHNVPGVELGALMVRPGTICPASRGVCIQLTGVPAHAAQPATGNSPARAMCRLIQQPGILSQLADDENELNFTTIVGAKLGDKAFGLAPGTAEIWATLRSESNATMAKMVSRLKDAVHRLAAEEQLQCRVTFEDVFEATVNSPRAVEIVRQSAGGLTIVPDVQPFPWSEDFGRFTSTGEGALFGAGAGIAAADLHHTDYQFPEELIPLASALLIRIVRRSLDEA